MKKELTIMGIRPGQSLEQAGLLGSLKLRDRGQGATVPPLVYDIEIDGSEVEIFVKDKSHDANNLISVIGGDQLEKDGEICLDSRFSYQEVIARLGKPDSEHRASRSFITYSQLDSGGLSLSIMLDNDIVSSLRLIETSS